MLVGTVGAVGAVEAVVPVVPVMPVVLTQGQGRLDCVDHVDVPCACRGFPPSMMSKITFSQSQIKSRKSKQEQATGDRYPKSVEIFVGGLKL
jgi:hypothetical protein